MSTEKCIKCTTVEFKNTLLLMWKKKKTMILVSFETYSSPWFERDTLGFAPSMEKLITYPNPSPHLTHALKIAKSRAKYGIEGKCATILQ